MTEKELATRAALYVGQALEQYKEVGRFLTVKDEGAGHLVSLRANLESAAGDLDELLKALP